MSTIPSDLVYRNCLGCGAGGTAAFVHAMKLHRDERPASVGLCPTCVEGLKDAEREHLALGLLILLERDGLEEIQDRREIDLEALHDEAMNLGSRGKALLEQLDPDDVAALVDDLQTDAVPTTPFQRDLPRIGRNDPCHCQSGRKYKKCHGRDAP